MYSRRLLPFLLLALLPPAAAAQAQSADRDAQLTGLLARGWAALAQQNLPEASRAASEALAAEPRSAAAASLAVEIEIERSRGVGGLHAYEQWLGSRLAEAPYVLRQVARALLWDAVGQQQGSPLASEALEALAADGDRAAAGQLAERAGKGSLKDQMALASTGDEKGVAALIEQVQTLPAAKVGLIEALGRSGSRKAVPVLTTLLTDGRDEHRAAAAEALGRLGADADRLKPLLKDPNFTVRLKAAGALYRLEDPAGLDILQQLAGSEHAGVRLAAAEELSSRPDAGWLTLVRSLTEAADPAIRLQSARLMAPHEPDTAARVLEALGGDDNPAIREEAGRLRIRAAVTDFQALRKLLRVGAPEQVAAAGRILELTR